MEVFNSYLGERIGERRGNSKKEEVVNEVVGWDDSADRGGEFGMRVEDRGGEKAVNSFSSCFLFFFFFFFW